MFGRNKQKQYAEIPTVNVDFLFCVQTTHYNSILLGLHDHGRQMLCGQKVSDTSEAFYRIIGEKMPDITRLNPAHVIEVDEDRTNLSQLVETFWASKVEFQSAKTGRVGALVVNLLPMVLTMGLGLAGYYAAGVAVPGSSEAVRLAGTAAGALLGSGPSYYFLARKVRNEKNLEASLAEAGNALGRNLLKFGIDKGVIPPNYLIG